MNNMSNLIVTTLKEAAKCFTEARKNLGDGAVLLHEIKEKEMWRQGYKSFGAYVESECQISQSFAAKLVQVYAHFVIQHGLNSNNLREIDAEKLYLALRLPSPPEKQLEQARLLSRSELKAEIASKGEEECKHETTITICASCHARV